MILVRASGVRGLKRRSFILWKIRHRRPRIWNKRRIRNRKGKAALPCPCMNREACCLQLGQLTDANWNHPLVSGFTRERRLLHPATALRHSTNELLTELKLNLDLEKKKKKAGSATRCTLIEGFFSTIMLLLLCVSIYAFHTLIRWQSSLSRSTRTHYLLAADCSLLTVVVWWCVYH